MRVRTNDSKREQPQAGVHMARVVALADIGHQPPFTWKGGEADSSYRFEITYELVNARMEDGRPFWVSEEVNNTDNEKGKLRQRVMATGIQFSNIQEILDKPVMITVELNEKGYPKIINVAGVPQGLDIPGLSNETTMFDIYNEIPQLEEFRAFPEFKRNKIIKALDFNETSLYKALEANGEVGEDKF